MVGKVIDIDFYTANSLPPRLQAYAREQKFVPCDGIFAVKTLVESGKPPAYVFHNIGKSPADIKAFMHRLAAEDGADLDDVVRRAFSDT